MCDIVNSACLGDFHASAMYQRLHVFKARVHNVERDEMLVYIIQFQKKGVHIVNIQSLL